MGIRVVSLRAGAPLEHQRDPEETLVYGDRRGLFGNPHFMEDESDAERERVIALFKADLDADLEREGVLSRGIERLARRVRNGEQIALGCWCKPKACHLDHVLDRVKELL